MDISQKPLADVEELRLFVENVEYKFFVHTGFISQGEYTSFPHFHDFYELFYCAKGRVDIVCDADGVQLEVGDIGIIPPQISHSIHTYAESVYTVISFWHGEKMWDSTHIHHLRHLPVDSVFRRMIDYHFGNYKYRKALVCACLSEIWTLLMEYQQKLPPQKKEPANIDTDLYRRYVISNYFSGFCIQDLNLPELADMLNLSVHQTQRIVEKNYGCSFQERLIALRMEKAKMLLTQTTLPVAKICADVGYKSIQGFLAVFKKTTGMTPSAYRKSHL